jgi:adenine-specific DNA methylase
MISPVQPEPHDFVQCPDCGERVLLVGYWDDQKRCARRKYVHADFVYKWTQRASDGRLVVHDEKVVLANAHTLTCMVQTAEREAGPYQREG